MEVSKRNAIWWILTSVVALSVVEQVDGQRGRFWPRRWSRNDADDIADDPHNVDERFGWSWGAASHRHRPQFGRPGNSWNNNESGNNFSQDQRNSQTTTLIPEPVTALPTLIEQSTPANAATIVLSDEFYDCMQRCPQTSEYNPICGSNNQNYHNIAKLTCANNCGANVVFKQRGPCQPLG